MSLGPYLYSLIGRLLIASLFVLTSLKGFMNFQGFTNTVSKFFIFPSLVAAIGLSIKLLGGLSLASGFFMKEGALALIIFMSIVTPLYHAFWKDGSQMAHFLKNIAVIGGLCILLAYSEI